MNPQHDSPICFANVAVLLLEIYLLRFCFRMLYNMVAVAVFSFFSCASLVAGWSCELVGYGWQTDGGRLSDYCIY